MGSRLEAKSAEVRKRIEAHTFESENGEEYTESKFGGYADYFRRKKIKLQNLDADTRQSARDKPAIFKNVVAHVNGYTQPSLNDLHHLIVTHGGSFIQYLDGKTMVTHIIASNLTPKKKVEFSRYRIVKPAWVVDSIKVGKLLPWESYRIIEEVPGQRLLGFENGNVVSQISDRSEGYRGQTETSWYTNHVKEIALQVDQPQSKDFASRAQDPELRFGDPVAKHEQDDDKVTNGDESPGHGVERGISLDDENRVRLDDSTRCETFQSQPSRLLNATEDFEKNSSQAKISNSAIAASGSPQHLSADRGIDFEQPGVDGNLEVILNVADFAAASAAASSHDESDDADRPDSDGDRALSAQIATLEPRLAQSENTIPQSKVQEISPEEHNALLLADPKVWKSTVVNPAFLKQYYEESRLHHLSTWKAALKSQLQAQAAERSSSQKARSKRLPGTRRYVLHVDFDSFFAAVSLRKSPQYIDKPVVVAHGNGSGAEIASCNYPARKFGIKNGMWMKHAQKLCPELKVLPYDFKGYEEASRSFYDTIIDTGGVVQSVSVDEALVDVSNQCIQAGGHDGRGVQEGSVWREQSKAESIAQTIRDEVKARTGCAVSVGIGGNILLAKLALRKAKPAGQHQLRPDDVLGYLGELSMQDLPGIAHSMGGKLEEIGVKLVKDVREMTKERLMSVMGPKTGEKIWDYSRGIDHSEVGDQVIRKSVSAEVNWGIRFVTQQHVDEFIGSLCEELQKRLLEEGVKGRQLTVKIMRRAADAPLDPPKHLGHGKCDTYSKSVMLGVSTNDNASLCREALSVLKGFGFTPGEFRGLGLQMQKLNPIKFSANSHVDSSQKKLQFNTTTPRKRPLSSVDVPAENIESPKKPLDQSAPQQVIPFQIGLDSGDKRNAPLNTLGTQFLLPSQVDPAVLQELPEELRSKLFPLTGAKAGSDTKRFTSIKSSGRDSAKDEDQPPHSRATERSLLYDHDEVSASQMKIDPEALNALPPDIRADVLTHYAAMPDQTRRQAVLPQSPRKDRTIRLPKKLTTPTKRRGRPIGGGGFRAVAAAHSTLTQSNFVPTLKATPSKDVVAAISDGFALDEISPEFLSALPEDIRGEVIAQARRERLQKKAGLDIAAKKKKPAPVKDLPRGQRTLQLPPRPPKPTFTIKSYSTLPELRDAVEAWYHAFRTETPDEEDTTLLVDYLKLVILDEGDMDKAVSAVKWLRWVLDREGISPLGWSEAVAKVEAGVQNAITGRGLGRVDF